MLSMVGGELNNVIVNLLSNYELTFKIVVII